MDDDLKTNEAEDGKPEPPDPNGSTKGWNSRGYLPHLDSIHALQFLTFRLADSLPRQKLEELKLLKSIRDFDQARRKKVEQWLDSGYGCCALAHPKMAQVMQQALLKFHGERYQLIAWCIMPNHVHVLIEPNFSLSKIVQSWKSYTGRWAMRKNAELELRVPGGQLWMPDYWDRYIRNQSHLEQVIEYIHNNPVKAGLCKSAAEWPWSGIRERGAPAPQHQSDEYSQ